MAKKTGQYSSVDELPDLLQAKKTDYKSVDELPDLKKKESSVSGGIGGTVGSSKAQSSVSIEPPNPKDNPFAIGQKFNQPPKLELGKLDLLNNKKANIGEAVAKDKSNSALGGVYNTIVGSVARLGGGIAETFNRIENVSQKLGEKTAELLTGYKPIVPLRYTPVGSLNLPETARKDVFNFIEKARTTTSSKENEQARSQFDITNGVNANDVKSLLFQAPSTILDMVGGALSGGSSFFFQSINDNAKELEENPNAKKLTDSEKLSYLFVQGAAQAALERFSIDKILKATGLTNKVKQKIANEITEELIKKGVKATAQDIENLALKKASSFAAKAKNIGLKATTSIGVEGTTEMAQAALNDGIKLFTNKIKNTEIFDEADISANFIKNVINSAAQGAVFGGITGAGASALSNTNKAIRKQVAEAVTTEDVNKIQSDIAQQVELGNITPEEAEAANITAQQYAQIASKIPIEIPNEKKYKIIGGIEQRETLKNQIQKANEEMLATDPAFHQPIKDRIDLLSAKLGQTNDYIEGIVADKKPTYKKSGEEFIKISPDGVETKITKEHYELATAIDEQDAINKNPEIKETEPTKEGEKIYRVDYKDPKTGEKTFKLFKNAEEGQVFMDTIQGEYEAYYEKYDGATKIEGQDALPPTETKSVEPNVVGDVVGVFHGTDKDFTEFKTNGLGVHFGTESQAKERGSKLVKADITLKKPFRMDDMGSDFDVARLADELLDAGLITKEKKSDLQKNGTTEDIKNILKENGYDGIVYKNRNEDKANPQDSYIVFDKKQIKQSKEQPSKGTDVVVDKGVVGNNKIELGNETSLVKKSTTDSDRNDGSKIHDYDIVDKDGKSLGYIEITDKGDYYQIGNVELNKTGTGLGTSLYTELAKKSDKPIYSDPSQTDAAKALWNRLVENGVAEKFEETVNYTTKTGVTAKNKEGTGTVEKELKRTRYRTIPQDQSLSKEQPSNVVVDNAGGFKVGKIEQPSVIQNEAAADAWLKGNLVNETGQKRLDRLDELEQVVNKSRASESDKKFSIDAINRERQSLSKEQPSKGGDRIKQVKLTDLPDRAFAVGMGKAEFEALKAKIQKEGFTQPIIIDKESGNVLDGQHRLLVAENLGLKEVPSIVMDNPTRKDLNAKIKELEQPSLSNVVVDVKKHLEDKGFKENPDGSFNNGKVTVRIKDNLKLEDNSSYKPDKNSIVLDDISLDKNNRGKGMGTSVMNDIIEYADKNNKSIYLEPMVNRPDSKMTKDQLVKWYEKLGFKVVNEDVMVRKPQPSNVVEGKGSGVGDVEAKEGFTEGADLNKIYAGLKAKYGDKKAATLYEAANRLVNPNTNTIVEIRGNGVVVKEGGKYILKPFGNTDANSKKWTLYKGLDVTEQFAPTQEGKVEQPIKPEIKNEEAEATKISNKETEDSVIKPETGEAALTTGEKTEAEVKALIEEAAASKKSIKAKNDAMEAEAAKHGEVGKKVLEDIGGYAEQVVAGKFEEKARKIAEKIMSSDIVPDWLKIDDQNVSTKGASSEQVKKALADATIKMGKLLDKGVEFGEAVKEAVKDLVDLMGEGMRGKIENGFAKDYEGKLNDLSGIKKALVSEKVIEGVDLERIGDKEMMALGRKILDTGEVKPEALVTKIITDGKGVLTPTEVVGLITYKRDIDNALQDTYKQLAERRVNGEDVGTLAVEAKNLERQQNDFDVMAVITAQQQSMAFRLRQRMLDREYNVVTQIEKYKANNNGDIPADVEVRFREIDKELKEVKAKLVEAEKAATDKEAQDAVDNIKDSVSREKKYTEEELQIELKKERASLRAEKKEKVHKAIDDMMDRWAKKITPDHLKNTNTKGVDAEKVFKSVGAIMKKAYDAGEVTVKIVEDAINYISEKLGNKDWGIEEFKNENWEEKLKSGTEKKDNSKPTINEDGTVRIPNQMLRDLVKRGLTDIEGLTKEVHRQVKKDLPDITERQVRDAITDYGKKVNPTADELQTQVNTAKRVGRLLSELEDVQNKIKKDKGGNRIKLTDKERELKRQISSLSKDIFGKEEKPPEQRLADAKESIKRRIEELNRKIKNKDFAKPAKKLAVTDTELVKLNAEKERLQDEFDKEQYALELKNRTVWQKWEDRAYELTSGLMRGLTLGVDLSAMGVQGMRRLFTNPKESAKAFWTGLKFLVSEKGANEFMDKQKAQPYYPLLKASKLAIDDKSGKQSVKEGMFVSDWINLIWNKAVAPVVGLGTKWGTNFVRQVNPYAASQRAYDGYVNSIRIQSYLKLAKELERDGYTYEADPKVFDKLADFVNTTTGRGSLGTADANSRWLNVFLTAPRKVISEVKLYTPYAFVYYARMPKAIRMKALKDFARFTSTFVAVNALMWASRKDWGNDEEDEKDNFWNMNSSDFLTHKIGDKRVSIGGGMKSILTMQSRLFTGEFTDQYGNTSKLGDRYGKPINTRLDLVTRFAIGKAAPAFNVLSKKLDERAGRPVEDAEIIKSLSVPLWIQDVGELYKNDPNSVAPLLTVLSIIGANVRVVEPSKSQIEQAELSKEPIFKEFIDKGINFPELNPEKIPTKEINNEITERLSNYDQATQDLFIKKKKEYLKIELNRLKSGDYKVYVNADGNATMPTEPKDKLGKAYKPFDQLTKKQIQNVISSSISGNVTEKVKKEVLKNKTPIKNKEQ